MIKKMRLGLSYICLGIRAIKFLKKKILVFMVLTLPYSYAAAMTFFLLEAAICGKVEGAPAWIVRLCAITYAAVVLYSLFKSVDRVGDKVFFE